MNPTRGARGPVTRYLGYLAAFLGVWIGSPIDDSVSVGIFRFDGPDRVYVRYLDSNWLYDYVNSHPKVLSYLTRQEKPNSVPEVIITASPERWYWFLENKVRYPKSFYGPVTLFRAR